jgi:hypothetical protein
MLPGNLLRLRGKSIRQMIASRDPRREPSVNVKLAIVRKRVHLQGGRGGSTKQMSGLEAARQRLEAAVARIEAMLADGNVNGGHPAASAERLVALGREVDLLGVECDSLRRALEAAESRNRRLTETADEVSVRLGRTIDELSELVEG